MVWVTWCVAVVAIVIKQSLNTAGKMVEQRLDPALSRWYRISIYLFNIQHTPRGSTKKFIRKCVYAPGTPSLRFDIFNHLPINYILSYAYTLCAGKMQMGEKETK